MPKRISFLLPGTASEEDVSLMESWGLKISISSTGRNRKLAQLPRKWEFQPDGSIVDPQGRVRARVNPQVEIFDREYWASAQEAVEEALQRTMQDQLRQMRKKFGD